jgi:recombination protein RecA
LAKVKKEEKEIDNSAIVEATIKKAGLGFKRIGDDANVLRPVLPTGIFKLDHYVLGAGGFPGGKPGAGRIVEVFGAPSGGKGTITSQLIANTQRLDPRAEIAYVDAECAFDAVYGQKLGVDTDRLLITQPTTGEEGLQAALDIVESGVITLCIIDSVAALVPKAELEGEMTDAHMGLQARMMGQALRKMTATVARTGTCLIFINQTRSNLGVTFGNPTTTPGGKALTFFSSLRLSVDRISQIKEKDINVGNNTKFKAVKNKTAAPFREAQIELYFDLPDSDHQPGFDGVASLTASAIEHGIWKQDGANYTLASTGETVRGKKELANALRSDDAVRRITAEATLVALGKSPEYIKAVRL